MISLDPSGDRQMLYRDENLALPNGDLCLIQVACDCYKIELVRLDRREREIVATKFMPYGLNNMNWNATLNLLKIALTLPVAYALTYPFLNPTVAGGVFKEVSMLGWGGSALVAIGFLMLVFLYCRDLQLSLSLVSPAARQASPNSVWLMFLLPYNFVEDFFIVTNVAVSLHKESESNSALQSFKSFGLVTGIGWCTAQIVSLLPNAVGSVAGMLALPFWIVHWVLIRRVNASLKAACDSC